MLGFGIGAIKEQFNTPSSKKNNVENNSSGGFKGFIDRAKSVVNPTMNLSDEKDYNGNINPIRAVIPKERLSNNTTPNGVNKENLSNRILTTPKLATNKIAKAGFNATKAYLSMGAKMAEGDFSKSPYKRNNRSNVNARKSNFQNIEYMNKIANNNEMKKLGDENEPKGYS